MLISYRLVTDLGLCVALLSATAMAQPTTRGDGLSSRTVRYTSQELATPAGAERLAARIRYAADSVCGGESIVQRFTRSFERCRPTRRGRAKRKRADR
jgi:UrcA family protein